MEENMLIVAGGAIGIYKLFEPLFLKLWDKKNKHEDNQSIQITDLERRCSDIERNIVYLKENKVSKDEHSKAVSKLNNDLSDMKSLLFEIKGILKGGENG